MVDEQVRLSLLIVEGRDLIRKGMRTASAKKQDPESDIPGEPSVMEVVARIQAVSGEFFFLQASLGAKKAIVRALGFAWNRYPDSRLILLLEESSGKVVLSYVFDCAVGCTVKRTADTRVLKPVLDAIVEGGTYLPEPGIRRLLIQALPANPARVATLLNLSPMECGVLYYLGRGKTSGAIAYLLGVDEHAVKRAYVTSVLAILRGRVGPVLRLGSDGRDGDAGEVDKGQRLYMSEDQIEGSAPPALMARPDADRAREAAIAEVRRLVHFYGIYWTAVFPPKARSDLDLY